MFKAAASSSTSTGTVAITPGAHSIPCSFPRFFMQANVRLVLHPHARQGGTFPIMRRPLLVRTLVETCLARFCYSSLLLC
jgi:hypothetical protein